MSAVPPASCLMSNWPEPGLARDSSRRMRSRMLRTSSRRVSRRTQRIRMSTRTRSNSARRSGSPATARACSSAWCSQVQASFSWYSTKAPMRVISMPPLPEGRSRTSTS